MVVYGIPHIWFYLCCYGYRWQSIESISNIVNMVDYGRLYIYLIILFMIAYRTDFINDLLLKLFK